MRHTLRWKMTAAAAFLALSGVASAQWAQPVQMRWGSPLYAGPSEGYPVVDYVSAGRTVSLHGCLRDFAWCEVSRSRDRGWVEADSLGVYRRGLVQPIYESRSWFTYPTLSFYLGDYWGRHYRDRPWYGDRNRYDRWDWRGSNRDWHRPRSDGRPPRRPPGPNPGDWAPPAPPAPPGPPGTWGPRDTNPPPGGRPTRGPDPADRPAEVPRNSRGAERPSPRDNPPGEIQPSPRGVLPGRGIEVPARGEEPGQLPREQR